MPNPYNYNPIDYSYNNPSYNFPPVYNNMNNMNNMNTVSKYVDNMSENPYTGMTGVIVMLMLFLCCCFIGIAYTFMTQSYVGLLFICCGLILLCACTIRYYNTSLAPHIR